MCVHIAGFPESWNRARIKEFAGRHTGTEVLNVVQSGTKTTICFRKSDIQKAISSLNGASVDDGTLVVQAATPKSDRKNITFSAILYELAIQNGIAPLLDQQQFYLLEKSLRTLYVGNIAPNVTELEIANVFQEYGPLEDVSLVLNLETGEHRGFAFVVFEHHDTCGDVLTADKFHSINGHIVKVQNSKPPKAVADLARQAGLNDMEGHRTHLLEQLLAAAKQILSCQQSLQTTNQYLDPYNQVVYVQANGTQTAAQPMNGTSVVPTNTVPPLRPTPAYAAVSPQVVGYQTGYQTMPLNGQVQLMPQVRQQMSSVPLQTQLGLQQVLQQQYQQYQPQTVANLHALQQQQLAMQQYMNQQQQLIQPQNQFSSFPPNQNQYSPQIQGQRFQVASFPQTNQIPQQQKQNLPNTQFFQLTTPNHFTMRTTSFPPPFPPKFQPEAITTQTPTNKSENAKKDSAPPATTTAATTVTFSPTQPTAVSTVPSPQLLPQMIPAGGNNPQMVLQSSFLHPSIIPNHTFINNNPHNQLFPSTANTIPQNQTVFQNGNSSFFVNPQQPQNQQIYGDSNQASNLQSSSSSVKPEAKRTRFAPY